MLWLHATERVTQEMGDMAIDYYGDANPNESTELLLALLPRKRLESLKGLASGAGLKIDAITPIGFAQSDATCGHVESPLVLSFRGEGAEITIADGQRIVSIRHLGPVKSNGTEAAALAPARSLAGELRRALANISLSNIPGGLDLGGDDGIRSVGGRRNLILWDDIQIDSDFLAALAEAVGIPIAPANPRWVGMSANGSPHSQPGLSAVALTLPFLQDRRPSLDFMNPRLNAPLPPRKLRPALWATAGAVVLLLLGGWLDITHLTNRVADAKARLDALQPELVIARPFVAKMEFAASFRSGNPKFLSCLADLTAALPVDGQTYLTNFNLHDGMKGTATGKSSTDENVLGLIDKLNAGGRFTQTHFKLDARDAKSTAHETTFVINFVYAPRDYPQTRPAAVAVTLPATRTEVKQ
jgi:hypothetical protein